MSGSIAIWLRAVGLGAALTLSGCTAQPLYTPVGSDQTFSNSFKGKVDFAAADDRVEQVVRDTMIFRLAGSGASVADAPVLSADITVRTTVAGRFRIRSTSADQTSASLLTAHGILTLTDPTTGQRVAQINRSAIAPFDRVSNQDFANERARLDAENRASRELGELFAVAIATQLRRKGL